MSFGEHRFDSDAFLRLRGMGTVLMDSLMNNKVGRSGSTDEMVSHRFRARESGNVTAIQLYWIASPKSGYALGNGGRIRVRVYPDDESAAHNPNLRAAPLASGEHVPRLSNGDYTSATNFYTPVAMSASQPLVKGGLYHVVYENIDANAASQLDFYRRHHRGHGHRRPGPLAMPPPTGPSSGDAAHPEPQVRSPGKTIPPTSSATSGRRPICRSR